MQSEYFLADNLDLRIHGKPLVTYDPLNLRVKNVIFDFDYAMSGWVMEIGCNYPEAQLTGEVYFDNHTVYSGKEKKVPMLNGYISFTGPANFTFKNSFLSTKTPLETDRSTI